MLKEYIVTRNLSETCWGAGAGGVALSVVDRALQASDGLTSVPRPEREVRSRGAPGSHGRRLSCPRTDRGPGKVTWLLTRTVAGQRGGVWTERVHAFSFLSLFPKRYSMTTVNSYIAFT